MTPIPRDPVSKVLKMIAWAVEGGPRSWGVRELAEELDMTPSTAHRNITALVREGMFEPDGKEGRYRLGLEFYRLARIAASQLTVEEQARAPMLRLFDACNETVVLVLYQRGRPELLNATCIASDHSIVGDQYSVQVVADINRWVPITMNATALAICSHLPDLHRKEFIEAIRFDARSPISAKSLPAEIAKVREQHFAIMKGYPNAGAGVVASPIKKADGEVVGALSLAMPLARFHDEERLGQLVLENASAIQA